MDKYTRYFKATEGDLVNSVISARADNKKASAEYSVILDELGAKPTYYQNDNRLVAMQFDEPDKSKYKRMKCGGWYPKLNNKEGRAINSRIISVRITPISSCLEVVGLSSSPTIFSGRSCYFPTITVIPSEEITVIIGVPWHDENPDKIDQYAKDRQAGSHRDGNLDALLWKPKDYLTEIKEWEVQKIISDYNESTAS
jgi:hypothetical protein